MAKILVIGLAIFVLSLGLAPGSQAKSMAHHGLTMYNAENVIGLPVKASDGTQMGKLFDVMFDSHGRVDFALISQPGFDEFPGRIVAVPIQSLMIPEGRFPQGAVVLKVDKEKFYEAPDWGNENLADLRQAASLDRYFGVQPYWTERTNKTMGGSMN